MLLSDLPKLLSTSLNSDFQSHFSASKIGQIFPKKIFCEEYLIRRPTSINEIFWKLWFLMYFIYKKKCSVHNFGKSNDDII